MGFTPNLCIFRTDYTCPRVACVFVWRTFVVLYIFTESLFKNVQKKIFIFLKKFFDLPVTTIAHPAISIINFKNPWTFPPFPAIITISF